MQVSEFFKYSHVWVHGAYTWFNLDMYGLYIIVII